MRVPLSWLKDYVAITITAEELAERLTLAGLEVVALDYIGVPQGKAPEGINVPPSDHLVWARDKILLGAIREVKAHPNADRLVLALVDYGAAQLEQVVTGAPNLYPFKDKGPLDPPLLTALALEGAEVFDGHAEGRVRMILKEKALRGIPNRSMVCSGKELGLSDDHEGILLFEDLQGNPKPGTPLVDVLGDVIFEIDLTPNVARAYSIIGVAREVAALTGESLHEPSYEVTDDGAPIQGQVAIEIHNPDLNPRFVASLTREVTIKPSPGWMQRRLIAVGERPINNVVDITNYVMFETGQPLHAFDYDVLVRRAGGKAPTISTRTARPGEKIVTLDGTERTLEDFTMLVCDTAGVLSVGGIMGGDESKILPTTRNILLETAAWNYINIRRSLGALKMSSEAGLRLSRGVHPEQTIRANRRAVEFMHEFGGGTIAKGMVDVYPKPALPVEIDLPMAQVERLIGIPLNAEDTAAMLRRLQFEVTVQGDHLLVKAPDHRLDIGTGDVGIADVIEEIARIYGYDRIPNTLIEDMLPEQHNNESLSREELLRDLLSQAGLREVVNYRLTTPEAEARLNVDGIKAGNSQPIDLSSYVMLANPISADKVVLRHTLLNSLLENIAVNCRHHPRQKLFEIGPVFFKTNAALPLETSKLGIALTGPRSVSAWDEASSADKMDFFDLKGILETLAVGLRIGKLRYEPATHPAFHPGRGATIFLSDRAIGVMGEIHPLVQRAYDLEQAVVAAEVSFDDLSRDIPLTDKIEPILTQPAVYEDIALIVNDQTPAGEVENVIRKAGGELLREIRLFDVYRGDSIPAGKKSLAYALTYQSEDHTLTDKEAAKVRQQVVKAAERQLGAVLRAK